MALTFNLKKNDVPVTIESEQGNLNLKLVEMSAALRDQYLDTVAARMHIVNGQPQGIKKYEGMQADLLARCLLKEDGKQVSPAEIQSWPSSVVTQLFDEAQKLNHLTRAEDSEKKV